MAALPAPVNPLTIDEYLALERASKDKHEFLNGEIFAMSGASLEHNLIVASLVACLHAALRHRPCLVLPSDMKLHVPATGLFAYPDVMVVCGEPMLRDGHRDVLLNPSVIVEVLSDSTERYDRGDKFAAYQTIESLRDFLLVSSKAPRIEHFARRPDGWLLRTFGSGDRLMVESIGSEIAVDDVFAKVFVRA